MWRLYISSKRTGERVGIIATGLSESEADAICEAWGWSYCDENGISYWMDAEFID